jgi:hypothetical protein
VLGERTRCAAPPPARIFYCSIFHHHFAVNSEFIRHIHLADSSQDWLETSWRAFRRFSVADFKNSFALRVCECESQPALRLSYVLFAGAGRRARAAGSKWPPRWKMAPVRRRRRNIFYLKEFSLPFCYKLGWKFTNNHRTFYYSNVQERGEYLLLKMWLLRERESEKKALTEQLFNGLPVCLSPWGWVCDGNPISFVSSEIINLLSTQL